MLSNQQQALVQAIQQLDLDQVQSLLAEGLDPNFIDAAHGFPVSIVCDGLFVWWENVCEAYEAGKPFTDVEKHLGHNWVRTVSMDSTDGLQRGSCAARPPAIRSRAREWD